AVKALVLAASVWRGLGSLDVATALASHAATKVPPGDHELGALVAHQQAKLHRKAGDIAAAARSLGRAVRHYRSRRDTYGETRAKLLRVGLLEAEGRLERSIPAAREALAFAERHDHGKLVLTARLELGRLLVAAGRDDEGLAVLREALGRAIVLD